MTNNELLKILGRTRELFLEDLAKFETQLSDEIKKSRFLVLGGAGSIGQAVVKEIFARNPLKLHVVDISENNLVELVRDIRSSLGYIDGEFSTFTLDIGSWQYDAFFEKDGNYDYVLNLSALKHVRSEKDPFTLMRMIEVNILNTDKTLIQCIAKGVKKYFCVSTDKAANPVNMMGASKRIMEMFVMRRSREIDVSMARFANVAFSDGSLLHGFNQRLSKKQPIVAPNDVKRYFVTSNESGLLCLFSCLLGDNRDIFFPKLDEELHLVTFSEIAKRYLQDKGYEVLPCKTEDEARERMLNLPTDKTWPCLFTESDTTGEKDFEEFYTSNEQLDMEKFENLGVIKNQLTINEELVLGFEERIKFFIDQRTWTKLELVNLFHEMLPNLTYEEKGKFLESKM